MKEADFTAKINEKLKDKSIKYCQARGLAMDENPVYALKVHNTLTSGVPDCYYEGYGTILWAEYKYVNRRLFPPSPSGRVDRPRYFTPGVSPLQNEWLSRTFTNATTGNIEVPLRWLAWVVVGTPEQVFVIDKPPFDRRMCSSYDSPMSHGEFVAELFDTLLGLN